MSERVQDAVLTRSKLLCEAGSQLGRPTVDTLNGSSHANMKELRFSVGNEVWRIAFAFDPQRSAILLVGGDKRGRNQKQFYKQLIKIADLRYDQNLQSLTQKGT